MNDLIIRQDAINAFYNATSDGDKAEWCVYVINSLPSAQPGQKVGIWVETNNPNYSPFDNSEPYNAICSECFYTSDKKFNYCPNCGAKMEKEV